MGDHAKMQHPRSTTMGLQQLPRSVRQLTCGVCPNVALHLFFSRAAVRSRGGAQTDALVMQQKITPSAFALRGTVGWGDTLLLSAFSSSCSGLNCWRGKERRQGIFLYILSVVLMHWNPSVIEMNREEG